VKLSLGLGIGGIGGLVDHRPPQNQPSFDPFESLIITVHDPGVSAWPS
jgi:hypothetical protein